MNASSEGRPGPQVLTTGPDQRPGRELIYRGAIAGEVQAVHSPNTPQVEALRETVARLLFWRNDQRPSRLAVVSTDAGDGRTFVTANLAVLFALAGKRVLLVDADLRGGRIHSLFGCDASPGLSDLLPGDADWRVIRPVEGVPGLYVLPGGGNRDTPLEFLNSSAFGETLDSLEAAFDLILLDTPARSGHLDAEVIAAQARSALMVVYRDHTPVRSARRLADSLTAAGVRLVGSVLNDRD